MEQMNDGVRRIDCTWSALTAKMQQEQPLVYEKCIIYIRREKLRNGFVAKRIYKANSQGTQITFEKVQTREEAKEAAVQLIDDYFDTYERKEGVEKSIQPLPSTWQQQMMSKFTKVE